MTNNVSQPIDIRQEEFEDYLSVAHCTEISSNIIIPAVEQIIDDLEDYLTIEPDNAITTIDLKRWKKVQKLINQEI